MPGLGSNTGLLTWGWTWESMSKFKTLLLQVLLSWLSSQYVQDLWVLSISLSKPQGIHYPSLPCLVYPYIWLWKDCQRQRSSDGFPTPWNHSFTCQTEAVPSMGPCAGLAAQSPLDLVGWGPRGRDKECRDFPYSVWSMMPPFLLPWARTGRLLPGHAQSLPMVTYCQDFLSSMWDKIFPNLPVDTIYTSKNCGKIHIT